LRQAYDYWQDQPGCYDSGKTSGWFGAGGGVGEGKPPPETETETETENPAAPSKRMCQKAGKR